jgi:D-alanyl-D-alanine carboxypeptidase/D-alanyl-D-alanine-endopeptidase (penicillin-binding protein 4)
MKLLAAWALAALVPASSLPSGITAVIHKPQYAHSSWYLLVSDLQTSKPIYERNSNRLAFTGSVRKLFSVGLALDALGANHRFVTPVYRRGSDLILVASGDLTLGGRRTPNGSIAVTDFDHNDANNLGTAILTPQDPLTGLNQLAVQVREAGIRRVTGDVIVDDRLFQPYRVPNGNLLVTPVIVNENLIDVWVTPGSPGRPAHVDWRPKTPAFTVRASVRTVPAGQAAQIQLSNDGDVTCIGSASCAGTISGTIPIGYKAPLSASATLVRTFRIEDPASFARIAFIAALKRVGVAVSAKPVARNASGNLPAPNSYVPRARVASYVSPPYADYAKLILKISLNLGANLSLSLFGLTHGERTITGSLAAEKTVLVRTMGIAPGDVDFPTNGSGSPDSRAAARATVQMLLKMSRGSNAAAYRSALPILGVDGSLSQTGRALPSRGHVNAKTGTTLENGNLKAQVLAGYIDAKSGRRLAFALYVNDAGAMRSIEDVTNVFDDEAQIVNAVYESN